MSLFGNVKVMIFLPSNAVLLLQLGGKSCTLSKSAKFKCKTQPDYGIRNLYQELTFNVTILFKYMNKKKMKI